MLGNYKKIAEININKRYEFTYDRPKIKVPINLSFNPNRIILRVCIDQGSYKRYGNIDSKLDSAEEPIPVEGHYFSIESFNSEEVTLEIQIGASARRFSVISIIAIG